MPLDCVRLTSSAREVPSYPRPRHHRHVWLASEYATFPQEYGSMGNRTMHAHELAGLRRRADALRAEGYVLDIRLEGYVVRRNDRFVGDAAINGRYKGRSATMKMAARFEHLKSAVILGEGHQARLDHLASFTVDRFVPNEGDTVLDRKSTRLNSSH